MFDGGGEFLSQGFQLDDETKQKDNYIRENWASMTALQIGERLGCSRNAVIGRAHRMGLHKGRSRGFKMPWAALGISRSAYYARGMPVKKRKPVERRHVRSWTVVPATAIRPPRKPSAELRAPGAAKTNCSLMELNGTTCRWPLGEPRTPSFCYCGASDGVDNPRQPYCTWHQRISNGGKSDGTT